MKIKYNNENTSVSVRNDNLKYKRPQQSKKILERFDDFAYKESIHKTKLKGCT